MNAYNLQGFIGIIVVFALIDVAMKGWAMWRAAKMNKLNWFIFLLIINSMGVLPLIFILLTRDEYAKLTMAPKKK